ncbi:SPRY domain-containing protein [Paenibacillus sp. 1-18]|uniref:SPRY domain-containing protein n=1 Tax=Paenibacillus sp. 1-18 TaxID=1333846 RepID=UPI00046EAAEE|nr:SPRY domain-containing protein [Paenibacillus sp. 1-18]
MKNIIFKKLGTIMLALLIGVSVFSLFPTVTKAETVNVTWSDATLTKTIPQWNQADIANVGKSSGKWYWEVTLDKGIGNIGIASSDKKKQISYESNTGRNYGPTSPSFGTGQYDYGKAFKANDVISVALDLENNTITFYNNGISQGVSKYTPSLVGTPIHPLIRNGLLDGPTIFTANFGASDFKYPVPEGFLPYQESGTSTTPDPSTKPDPSTTPDPSTKPDPSTTPDPSTKPGSSDTDGSSQTTGDRAILTVTMDNGFDKEFDLSKKELNAFIAWYDAKDAGRGPSFFAIDKHNNNKGPFSNRKDYVIFNKILTFDVSEYSTK